MSKRKMMFLVGLLALLLPMLLAACGSQDLEQAVEDAAEQVEEAATANADEINEAVTEVEEAVEAVTENVEETADDMAEEAEEAADEAMEEMDEEMADVDYDTEVYGMIDEIDLNGVTVSFWHQHTGGREEELNALIDEFNQATPYGIVVEATNEGGYSDIYDKMIAGLTTGDVPALVVAYQNQAAAYQVADGLVSLNPYISHPEYGLSEEDRADFFQSFLSSDQLPQFGDEAFGFPPNRSMEVMYYNQTWLEELGYDGPPQTPEEFQEMACAATDGEAGTVGYEISTDASRVASFIFARGEDIYDNSTNQFTYNTPEAVAAMTMMQEMFAEGCAILIAERFGDQADFAAEKTLFTIGSSSGLPFYAGAVADSGNDFEWSVAPIPYTGSDPVQNIYGASVSIPQTTPEEQLAAWLFLKYYTNPESQARWAVASNYFPVRESVAEGLDEYFAENPAYQTAFELLQYGKTEAPVAGYDNVRDEVAEAYSRILDGEDVETVLAELDETANEILAESAP